MLQRSPILIQFGLFCSPVTSIAASLLRAFALTCPGHDQAWRRLRVRVRGRHWGITLPCDAET